MDRLAVLGANGFIGTQAVEFFHLQDLYEVRPVVRGYGSLARLARFNLDNKIADATDVPALTEAFRGCRFVLHAALGDARTMIESVDAVYTAAENAGVERVVYLSSLAVHGLNPPEGTSESSELSSKQRFVYSNVKVIAERNLLKRRDKGSVEVVVLRPGIVYGPRSWLWTAGLANDLLLGNAYLAHNGAGICNAVYVDNLLDAARLSMQVKAADNQAFLVGDSETVTWLEFYERISQPLGIESNDIYRLAKVEADVFMKPSRQDFFNHVRALPLSQSVVPFISGKLKSAIKKVLLADDNSFVRQSDAISGIVRQKPRVAAELVVSQSCKYKVSHKKASEILGYKPHVSFSEGMRRSIAWLKFAGYPVE